MPSADSNCCTPSVFCGLTPSCDRFFSLLDLAFLSLIPSLVVLGAM